MVTLPAGSAQLLWMGWACSLLGAAGGPGAAGAAWEWLRKAMCTQDHVPCLPDSRGARSTLIGALFLGLMGIFKYLCAKMPFLIKGERVGNGYDYNAMLNYVMLPIKCRN